MSTLKNDFINGTARISYREMSARGGRVIAWFSNNRWFHRHETETDDTAGFQTMSEARARYLFPSDARAV